MQICKIVLETLLVPIKYHAFQSSINLPSHVGPPHGDRQMHPFLLQTPPCLHGFGKHGFGFPFTAIIEI